MLRVIAARENVQLVATTDLFLEIDQVAETCGYWFADHAHRTVFWLHPVDTDVIGLPNSHSKRHLRESCAALQLVMCVKLVCSEYSLEENYWAHVEMFPATASQYQPSDIFSNLIVPTTTFRSAYSALRAANTGTPTRGLIRPQAEFFLHARSDSPPIIRTFPAQTEPSPFFWSSVTEAPNEQRQRSSQHGITRVLPPQTVSDDQGSTITDTGEHVSL
jgi:hypothetical protein